MGRASEFLELYKEVEEALQVRYMKHPNERISNAIVRFMNSPEGKRFKEELNLCREVRNLLSHHARFEGEEAVIPSEKLVAFLRKLLNYLQNPPEAKGIETMWRSFTRLAVTPSAANGKANSSPSSVTAGVVPENPSRVG